MKESKQAVGESEEEEKKQKEELRKKKEEEYRKEKKIKKEFEEYCAYCFKNLESFLSKQKKAKYD